MARTISNEDDVIDSRDVIKRIEELEGERDSFEDGEELRILKALTEEASGSPDWEHGETLVRESYFTDYIKELIHDCYEFPKEFDSGNWPWRHMAVDYEAAAEEAKVDYNEADFDGVTYLIRA